MKSSDQEIMQQQSSVTGFENPGTAVRPIRLRGGGGERRPGDGARRPFRFAHESFALGETSASPQRKERRATMMIPRDDVLYDSSTTPLRRRSELRRQSRGATSRNFRKLSTKERRATTVKMEKFFQNSAPHCQPDAMRGRQHRPALTPYCYS